MRAYKIHHPEVGLRFATSEAEARAARVQMFDNTASKVKRSDIVIDMIEIPTTKAELISWLQLNFGVQK